MTTDKLLSLSRDLDLFAESPPSDDCIRRGLVPALPVAALPAPTLVWGWPLVRRAALLQVADLPVKHLEVSAGEALIVALDLESRGGEYRLSEQARILDFYEEYGEDPSNSGRDLAALSQRVRGDGALLDQVSRYRALPPPWRDLVDSDFLSLKTAARLTEFPVGFITGNRVALEGLSFSNRRRFLELAAEVTAHVPEETRVELLAALSQALDSSDPAEMARRLRFPTLTDMEDRFRNLCADVLGSSRVTLEPPPYFEGDKLTVTFSFRNCRELGVRIKGLGHLKDRCDEFQRFF